MNQILIPSYRWSGNLQNWIQERIRNQTWSWIQPREIKLELEIEFNREFKIEIKSTLNISTRDLNRECDSGLVEIGDDSNPNLSWQDSAPIVHPDVKMVEMSDDPKKVTPNQGTQSDRRDLHGTLLGDAMNGFNKLSRKAMLWASQHRWPIGSRFSFNCYWLSAILVVWKSDGTYEFILSEEGVTQGNPLAMILYGLALIPLVEQLQKAFPDVILPFYADDAGMSGQVSCIAAAMKLLDVLGPAQGYYPEASKIIFVAKPEDMAWSKEVLLEFNYKYTDRNQYIDEFIGSTEKIDEWLTPQIKNGLQGTKSLVEQQRNIPKQRTPGSSNPSKWSGLLNIALQSACLVLNCEWLNLGPESNWIKDLHLSMEIPPPMEFWIRFNGTRIFWKNETSHSGLNCSFKL